MQVTTKTVIGAGLAAVAAVALAATWDSSNFTMAGRVWQPAPTGHVPGKDNAGTLDGDHHLGEDCGICHAPAPAAPDSLYQPAAVNRVFTMTATFMDSRAGRRTVAGGEVILQDYEGNVISMTSNDVGNAWTEAPIAPDARLPPETYESATWRYKAWVRFGGLARPMMTIPAVGGMSVPRMSCGMHHVQMGTLGSLASSPEATLRSYPPFELSFRRHVFPILRAKCAPCHVPGPTTASQAGETFDYGAGLDLMNLDGSSVTLVASTGQSTTYTKVGIRDVASTEAPDASLLLTKPLQGGSHGGGAFWTTDHPDYRAIRGWIAEGARDN